MIGTILISILIIFIFHQLWNYIKDNYSTKKTKDLVSSQTAKYKMIIEELTQQKDKSNNIKELFFDNEENKIEIERELIQYVNHFKGCEA